MTTQSSFDNEDIDILKRTQVIRNSMVTKLMRSGQVPDDIHQQRMLLDVVNSMDKSTLQKAKVKAEDKSNESKEARAKAVAQFLLEARKKQQALPVVDSAELPQSVPAPELVPGETDIGMQDLSYETFFKDGD